MGISKMVTDLAAESSKNYILEESQKVVERGGLFDYSWLSLQSLTNIYVLLWFVIGIMVLIHFVKQGYKNGLVRELASIISMLVSALCFGIILDIVSMYSNGELLSIVTAVISLVVVMMVYGVVRFILTVVHLFARLPVIRIADNVLGVAGGLFEGLIFVSIVKYGLNFFGLI